MRLSPVVATGSSFFSILALLAPNLAYAEAVYVIRSGDNLTFIAASSGTTVDELIALNGLTDPDRIYVGSRLIISPRPSPTAPPPLGGESTGYRVLPGDTLGSIAARFGVEISDIAEANEVQDEHLIYTGAVLHIPGSSRTAPTSSPELQRHTVVVGETLGGIGLLYGVSAEAVALQNRVGLSEPIHPGQLLTIPRRSLPHLSDSINVAIRAAASEQDIDYYLLLGRSLLESGWQMGVVSPTGAVGLFQLMPESAEWAVALYAMDAANWRVSEVDNARVGAVILGHMLLLSHGDVRLALAAYYQGWTSVEMDGPYPETLQYADDVKRSGMTVV